MATAAKKTVKTKKKSLTYREAGVDIDAGNRLAVAYLKHINSTLGPQVIRNDGGFAGLHRLRGQPGLDAWKKSDPVLVSSTDGVGTKLKIAMDKHDTVGIDLVAMSANDVLVQGAEPIIFLDYLGTGKVNERVLEQLVAGCAEGCRQAGCALLGGETAELPGFYAPGEYDLAGFVVGVAERKRLITGEHIGPGDTLLGIASSGLHSNGYSLARKALLEVGGFTLKQKIKSLGCTLGEEMLRPTRIYVKSVFEAIRLKRDHNVVKGLVHITGGGLYDNVPRVLPKGCAAEFDLGSWEIPANFRLIPETANVDRDEMFRVFNMGIGMVLACEESAAKRIIAALTKAGETVYRIGRIVKGRQTVTLRD